MPCSCMSTMEFAGISSALADPCAIHAWLSRVSCLRQADPCASHVCDHGSGGYLVCVRPTLVRPMCAIMALAGISSASADPCAGHGYRTYKCLRYGYGSRRLSCQRQVVVRAVVGGSLVNSRTTACSVRLARAAIETTRHVP
ncbi:hypothetical protein L210DRAFT_2037719 [Boletus edulis BED1]|uniref:Uncharacterized protein n=1 Tax=Boletus edulis BED1 TaxID=1328754 RepID=A0AAD4C9K7_BOLED|nr:hypothetical protein L210DRAFT_2037719 [Boletus edulis BED1]